MFLYYHMTHRIVASGKRVGSMLALESSEWEVIYDFCSHSHLPELTPLSPAHLKRILGNMNKHNDLCWRLFVLAHLANFILTPGWCDCLIAPEASPYEYILSYTRKERTNLYKKEWGVAKHTLILIQMSHVSSHIFLCFMSHIFYVFIAYSISPFFKISIWRMLFEELESRGVYTKGSRKLNDYV